MGKIGAVEYVKRQDGLWNVWRFQYTPWDYDAGWAVYVLPRWLLIDVVERRGK